MNSAAYVDALLLTLTGLLVVRSGRERGAERATAAAIRHDPSPSFILAPVRVGCDEPKR